MSGPPAVTWWGHASATVELDGVRVATDPLLVTRLAHLRRHGPAPAPAAREADLVLVSHLHSDHLHLPSLAQMSPSAPLVVPRGAGALLAEQQRHPALAGRTVVEVAPGEQVDVAGCRVEALPAVHDGRRLPWSSLRGPALGYRFSRGGRSCWFPGDTGPSVDLRGVRPVDLALVPIGGWGPSLGEQHLDPEQAATALAQVGARAALPVHWGTFWPLGMRRAAPQTHHHLFVTPGERFAAAAALRCSGVRVVCPPHGARVVP